MTTFPAASPEVPASLAPPVLVRNARRPWSAARRRVVAGVVLALCSVILGIAAWLEPSPTGVGTHLQLRMPPCGWIAVADMPCPTCGMTTAFAHAADAHLWQSFRAQPLGAALAVAMAMTWIVCLYVVVTGSRLGGVFAKLWGPRSGWTLAGCLVAAWGYKVAVYKGWL